MQREQCRLSFFSGRVHPVESNSSHVIRGLINAALAEPSLQRQHQQLNVIIPFLNVDGVIHGWYYPLFLILLLPLSFHFLLIIFIIIIVIIISPLGQRIRWEESEIWMGAVRLFFF